MKNRTKYIALISILAILLLIWLLLELNPEKTYRVPDIKAPTNITGIVIVKGTGEKIILTLTNGNWMLEPGDYFADVRDVNLMLEALKSFEITDLVSGGSLVNYNLDALNRIEVKAYDGSREVMHVYIGKISATFKHTYVQFDDDANVYQAKKTFNEYFNKSFDGLISRNITELDKDSLVQVRIKENGKEYLLSVMKSSSTNKNEISGEVRWKASWKRTLPDNARVNSFLQKITPLTADGLAPGKMGVKTPYLRLIELKTEKETVSMYIIRQENTRDKFYIVGVKGNPSLFKVSKDQGKNLMENIKEF